MSSKDDNVRLCHGAAAIAEAVRALRGLATGAAAGAYRLRITSRNGRPQQPRIRWQGSGLGFLPAARPFDAPRDAVLAGAAATDAETYVRAVCRLVTGLDAISKPGFVGVLRLRAERTGRRFLADVKVYPFSPALAFVPGDG